MRRLWLAALAAAALCLLPAAAAQEPYHDYRSLKEDTRALAEEHPGIAEFRVHGTSVAGLEVFHVDVARDIGDRSDAELASLSTMYVDGGHHGNEILSMEAAYYFLEDVLEAAAEDPSVLTGKRLVVTPVVNPDGFNADQRQNAHGVDLNRNYPFHWGRYGTSEVPGHFTYRGPAPASEPETRANIDLMRGMDLEAYLSGHTGTYDIVLPWRESEDGPIPDWPMYEATLGAIENETGLEYRDPSGAGESTAWAYGNLTPFSVVMEVSEEQDAPASASDVEARLEEPIRAYHVVWENLTYIDGSLRVVDAGDEAVTLRNDGWAPAYNVTAKGSGLEDLAETETVDSVAPGETVTLSRPAGADVVAYQETLRTGEEPGQAVELLEAPAPSGDEIQPQGQEGALPTPGPGAAAGLAAALLGAAGARRRR